MATKLQHSESYPFSTKRLWEILSTEQYWHDLVEHINSGLGSVESVSVSADTVVVELRQGIPADKLPSAVTKIMPGDLRIPRKNTFRLVGDTIAGEMEATVEGAPVPVNIKGTVSAAGDPSTADYVAEVGVNLPMFGSKIEKTVVSELSGLLDAEREYTVDWGGQGGLT